MGRHLGVAVLLCALTACGNTESNENVSGGPGATNAVGASVTTTQGSSVTTQGSSSATTLAQGGMAATAASTTGSSGTGGNPGTGGTGVGGGAAGAACEDPCSGGCVQGTIPVTCEGPRCVCEAPDSPNKPVHQALLACDLDEPCPPSMRFTEPGTSTWNDGACLLEALRDRTPGIYHHEEKEVEDGVYTINDTFIVDGVGRVLMLRATINFSEVRDYEPVSSCTLKSYEALDVCVAAGTDVSGDASAICDNPDEWFEACESVTDPTCPNE